MPRSRYTIRDTRYAYFITSTVQNWLPIFTSERYCQTLTDAWEYLRQNRDLTIYAWVILDNHCHAILSSSNLSRDLATWRSYTGKVIMKQLQQEKFGWALKALAYSRTRERRGLHRDQPSERLQFWKDGTHPQQIEGDEMFEQKREYIEWNPVKRGLVTLPEHWRWSSAYETQKGSRPVLRCNAWYQPKLDYKSDDQK